MRYFNSLVSGIFRFFLFIIWYCMQKIGFIFFFSINFIFTLLLIHRHFFCLSFSAYRFIICRQVIHLFVISLIFILFFFFFLLHIEFNQRTQKKSTTTNSNLNKCFFFKKKLFFILCESFKMFFVFISNSVVRHKICGSDDSGGGDGYIYCSFLFLMCILPFY